jgi:hypothetical protein
MGARHEFRSGTGSASAMAKEEQAVLGRRPGVNRPRKFLWAVLARKRRRAVLVRERRRAVLAQKRRRAAQPVSWW